MRLSAWSAAAAILITTAALDKAQSVERQISTVDTVAAHNAYLENLDRDPEGLSRASRAANQQAGLEGVIPPVLLLGTGEVRAAPKIRQQVTSYAATYDVGGAELAVLGAAAPLVPSEPDPLSAMATALDSTGYVFEPADDGEDSDGADLSFDRFGATYVLRLVCDELDDPRCKQPDFLKQVATTLLVVGGKGVK